MAIRALGLMALSHDVGTTFVRQVVAAGLGLATMAFIARVYGPEGTGAYSVALLLPTMLVTFLNLGVAPSNVYFLGSAQIDAKSILRANLRIAAWLVPLGLAAGGIGITWFSDRAFPGVPTTMLWFALAAFPLGILSAYVLSLFQGLQRFQPFNLLLVGQPLLFLLLLVLPHLWGIHGLEVIVASYCIAQALTLLLAGLMVRPLIMGESIAQWDDSATRRILGYGMKAHLSNILAFVNYRADLFIANLYLGPAVAGLYAIAVSLAEKLWMVSQAVSTVILPRLSQLSNDEETRKRLTPVITRWVLMITFLGSLLIAAIAGPFITVIFGSDFTGAYAPLMVLLPGIVAGSGARVLANDIAARGLPQLNFYASIAVVCVNVVANLALIPPFGLVGAATATTLAYILNLAMRLVIYGRLSRNRWNDCIIIKANDLRGLRAIARKKR